MDTAPEIVLLLLGVAPEELRKGPGERDSWTTAFLAVLATAAKQGAPRGMAASSREVNRQPKSAYSETEHLSTLGRQKVLEPAAS